MSDVKTAFFKILQLFQKNNIEQGQSLPKQLLTEEIKSWPPELKPHMRNAWHILVGEGYIQDGHPDGPVLTPKGQAALESLKD